MLTHHTSLLVFKKIQNPAEVEIQDTSVKKVGVYDKGSTELGFDVLYEIEKGYSLFGALVRSSFFIGA